VKTRGFDVPESVVMVTGAEEADPGFGGMTTVQVVWSGQATGVIWPPTCALIWPDELKNLDPVTVTVWPARPLAGARADRAGGPPGSANVGEVAVEVGFEVGVEGGAGDTAPCPDVVLVDPPGTGLVAAPREAVVAVARPPDCRSPPLAVPTRAATIITSTPKTTPIAQRRRRSPEPDGLVGRRGTSAGGVAKPAGSAGGGCPAHRVPPEGGAV
jgi:hypothetical protein